MTVLDEVNAGAVAAVRARAWTERLRMSPLVAALAAILLILILPPTIFLVVISFYTTRPDGSFDQFTLRYYQQLFTRRVFPVEPAQHRDLRLRLGGWWRS